MVDRSDMDDELDEPMASQSVDSEAPLTHNSSKNNFFASPDEAPQGGPVVSVPRGSFKNTVRFRIRNWYENSKNLLKLTSKMASVTCSQRFFHGF